MDLLLDTTVFYQDPNLTSKNWRLVREYVRRGNVSVLVPEVVLDEVFIKFAERVQKARTQIESQVKEIGRLTETDLTGPEVEVERERDRYRVRFLKRLGELNLKILPYPKVNHRDVVARDLSRRKPFDLKGRGYRDALIWHSLLEHLKDNRRDCILVTGNGKDFSASTEDQGCLHEHLVSDLKSAGIVANIKIRRELNDFVNEFVKPMFERLDEFKLGLEQKKPIDLEQYLKENFDDVLEKVKNSNLLVEVLGVNLEEPFGISSLGELSEIGIQDVFELGDEEIYIEFEAIYDAEIYAYLWKSDAYALDEHAEVRVTDWNWNDHYSEVEVSTNLLIRFVLVWDSNGNDVASLEVESVETIINES